MKLKDNIKYRRNYLKLTLEDIAKYIEVSKQTVQKYESGVISNIPSDKIEKMAEILQTTPAYLMGWEEEKPEPKPCGNCHDEQTEELLCNYDKLNDDGKKEAVKRVSELTEIKRYLKEEAAQEFYIDFMDMPASAGTGVFLTEEYKSTIAVKNTCTACRASFALRVSGDSMEPQFYDGEIVFVKSAPKIEVGEIGIFVLNGEGYIKKLGNRRLISLNPKYNDIMFAEGDSIVCVGKVIGKEE